MAVAIEKGDRRAMAWAVVAMTVMILAVDQLLWKPLVAWSQRFRLGDVAGAEARRSWVLDLLRRSWIALPTSSSFLPVPYMSAVSRKVTPRSIA
jgi:NitT/TauT family transport system permease protein